jgi:hypothetical protein
MPDIDRSIRIAAPIERVWEVLVDIPRQPLWMHDLKEVVIETPGPLRVGSVAIGTVRMFGLSQSDPIEITLLDPPTDYGIAHRGAFRGHGTFHLVPLGSQATAVHWHESLRPTPEALPPLPILSRLAVVGPTVGRAGDWLLRVSDPLLKPIFELVFRADLRRLKQLIESTEPPGSGRDWQRIPTSREIDHS